MPTRGESGTRKRKPKPPPAPISENAMQARVTRRPPSPVDKQATIRAAEDLLKPWEVHPPGRPKKTFTPPPKVTQEQRYKAALVAPVSDQARKVLADTMTPQRREEHRALYTPPPKAKDTSLLNALLETPGSIAHTLGVTGKATERVVTAPAKSLARSAVESAYDAQTPSPIPGDVRAGTAGAKTALAGVSDVALGPDITRALSGESPSKVGLGVDLALLLPGTKATKLVRAAVEAEVAARGLKGVERAAAVEEAFTRTMEGQALPTRVVTAAKKSSTLRGPARVEAHRLIDEQVTDPLARRATKSQFDAHVYDAVKPLPARERKSAAAQIYHQLGEAMRSAPEHPVPGFRPVVDDVKAQANVRQAVKAREIFPEVDVRSKNAPETSTFNDVQVVGKIEPTDYMNRLNVAVGGDVELGLKLASWYREAMPILTTFFGKDAAAIMRGFAVSQANASPSGGLAAVLTIRDLLLRGEKIPRTKEGQTLISTVADSIQKAVQGEEVSKGLAAKLHDFAASLEGRKTRSWTADDIRGGAPVAVDIHALRDVGLVDPKIVSTLRDRHGIDVSKLTIDNPQSAAQGLQYELVAEKYRQLTQAMNDARFWGKDNWTPADVQALGWSAIQRIHGTFPEDLMFAVDRNTYDLAVEVLNGKTGLGRGLSYPAQMAVTQEIARLLPRFVHDENGFVRDMIVGPSGWQGGTSVAVNLKIVGSAGQAERIAQRLQRAFEQYDVWAVRSNVSISKREGAGAGRVAFEIRSDAFGDTDKVDKFWQALRRNTPEKLQKHLDGYMPFERDGMRGIRVVTQSGPKPFAKLPEYMEQTWEAAVRKSAEEAGLHGNVRYNATNVELRDAATAESRTRATYGGELPRGSGGVGDPLAVEARSALHDAIERHSGVRGSVRRGVATLSGEAGGGNPLAFFSRWWKPEVAADPAEVRANTIRQVADEYHAWARANPTADDALKADMAERIAAHNDVDPFGLRRFLATGKIPKGTTPEEEVAASLHSAKSVRGKQEASYSRERGARAQASEHAFTAAGGGVEGYAAGMEALRGELQKLHWGRFEDFDEDAVAAMINHIEGHPALKTLQKRTAQGAILRGLQGRVPTRSEIKLLEKVFPKHVVDAFRGNVSTFKKAVNSGVELINVPRALMASFDLSAPFRQGLMTGVRYPRQFFRNFNTMIRSAGSERYYTTVEEALVAHPKYDQAVEDGLSLTGLNADVQHTEEQFIGHNFAEKLNVPVGGGHSVGPGHVVRGSARAYTAFLNKTRMDIYDMLTDHAIASGLDLNAPSRSFLTRHGITMSHKDETVGESIARFVNSATGRGDVGPLTDHMATANLLLFSPRLLASRINFISPVYYMSLDPFARKEALKSARNLVGTIGLVLYLAKLNGAKVETDPRNSDFAKVRIGNTRIDVLGGFQQPIRLLSQLFTGKIISSTTGKELRLNTGEFGGMTRRDIAQRFFEAKLAPVPSFVNDWFKGTDFEGKPFSWKKATLQRLLPLLAQDAFELQQETGSIPAALAVYGVGAFGLGFQTYGPKPTKPKRGLTPPPGGSGLLTPSGGGAGVLSPSSGGAGVLGP